jgi:hypothetical protein
MYLHRDFHVRNSHDSNLPFYSNWSEVGVSRHIGTGGFKHTVKGGRVTVPGKPIDDLAPGTLNSILKQAGLKK